MLKEFFESRTFTDHAGEPSFGRKASFCILVFLGLLSVFSLCLVGWLDDLKHAQAVASHAKDILTWGSGLVGLLYGTAQASKGMAQMNNPTAPPGVLSASPVPTAPIVPGAPGPLLAPATTTTATAPQTGGA